MHGARPHDLKIAEHDSLVAFAPDAWNRLVETSAQATVFQRHEWMHAWWEAFSQPDWRVRLLAAHRGDELVGLAALYERPAAADPRRRSIHLIGEGHADYGGFIIAGDESEVADRLLHELVRRSDSTTEVHLDEMQQGSLLHRLLSRRCRSEPLQWIRTDRIVCPWVAVRGAETQARALLRKSSTRRHRAALERLGRIEIRHETEAQVIQEQLSSFFDWHVGRWARTPYPSLFEKEPNRAFYRMLTQKMCPSGCVVFSVLTLGGRPVSYHFGFLSNAKLLWYKPAFDVELARHSPGEVLLSSLIEYAIARNLVALDFTRGDEPFKRRYASGENYNESFTRVGSRSVALWHHVRGFIRTLLGRS